MENGALEGHEVFFRSLGQGSDAPASSSTVWHTVVSVTHTLPMLTSARCIMQLTHRCNVTDHSDLGVQHVRMHVALRRAALLGVCRNVCHTHRVTEDRHHTCKTRICRTQCSQHTCGSETTRQPRVITADASYCNVAHPANTSAGEWRQ